MHPGRTEERAALTVMPDEPNTVKSDEMGTKQKGRDALMDGAGSGRAKR